ncbi:MAG: general secretion pathway protein N [Alphaproteobacteria bacterium]
MKKWQWILLAVFTYLLLLIVYMPASYMTSYLQESTQNKIRFTGVVGTLFSGNSDALSYDGLRVNNVTWNLSPLSLLLLKANLDIKGGAIRSTEQIYIDGNINISMLNPEKLKVTNARIFAPAKPLLSQVDLPVAVTASGRFRVDIDSFELNQGCQQLSGNGSWLKAAVNIEGNPLDLGGFNAVLSCDPPAFAMQISPDNGIELDAKITFEKSGDYAAKGTFTIPSNFPNEVKQGASFFGESLGQGRYELDVRSR